MLDPMRQLCLRVISQMICVVETEFTPCVLELLGRKAFQGGLGRDGHEYGKWYRAMGKLECCGAGFRNLHLVRR